MWLVTVWTDGRLTPRLTSPEATQQTQNMCITFVQCRTNVEDVGPTLYKCYTHVFEGQAQLHSHAWAVICAEKFNRDFRCF